MADQPTTPSGSRWEPDPDETATTDDPGADNRRAQLRGRAILAGAATVLTLGGGLTGFVIGHSTAGDDNGFRPANFQQGPGGDGQQFGNDQQPPGFGQDGGGRRGFEGDGSSSSGTGSTGTGT